MWKSLFGKGDAESIIARAVAELQAKARESNETWGLGTFERWDTDLEQGAITFSDDDGPVVRAPVQVVGTYSASAGTWMWGWDHPSVREPLARAARLTRDFGEKHRLRQFTERSFECTQDDAWRFTAVAAHLSAAAGAYRGPTGPAFVFMTLGKIVRL